MFKKNLLFKISIINFVSKGAAKTQRNNQVTTDCDQHGKISHSTPHIDRPYDYFVSEFPLFVPLHC